MKKKIVILNGSPRAKGNTSKLIDAFSKGALSKGHEVSSFFLDSMKISGCKGCFGGGKDLSSPCTIKDDMEKVYEKYVEADIVVMASPLYFWTLSGQLRTAFDRLFAVIEAYPDYKAPAKECVLLMCAAGEGFEESLFYYDSLIKRLGWSSLGKVLVSNVNDIGDIQGRDELKSAEELGSCI